MTIRAVDTIMARLQGVELRYYTRAECEAATAIWLRWMPLADRKRLTMFLLTRCRSPRGALLANVLAVRC